MVAVETISFFSEVFESARMVATASIGTSSIWVVVGLLRDVCVFISFRIPLLLHGIVLGLDLALFLVGLYLELVLGCLLLKVANPEQLLLVLSHQTLPLLFQLIEHRLKLRMLFLVFCKPLLLLLSMKACLQLLNLRFLLHDGASKLTFFGLALLHVINDLYTHFIIDAINHRLEILHEDPWFLNLIQIRVDEVLLLDDVVEDRGWCRLVGRVRCGSAGQREQWCWEVSEFTVELLRLEWLSAESHPVALFIFVFVLVIIIMNNVILLQNKFLHPHIIIAGKAVHRIAKV